MQPVLAKIAETRRFGYSFSVNTKYASFRLNRFAEHAARGAESVYDAKDFLKSVAVSKRSVMTHVNKFTSAFRQLLTDYSHFQGLIFSPGRQMPTADFM